MSNEAKPEHEVDLTPHRLAPSSDAGLGPEDALTRIVGFVGESSTSGEVRVYLDLSFTSYYQMSSADVVRTESVDPGDADSPRVLWIRASAHVHLVRIDHVSGSASFVTGAIRNQFGARRETAAAGVVESHDFCIPHPPVPPGSDWCLSSGVPCPRPGSGPIFHC